jgi:hypothetical protein
VYRNLEGPEGSYLDLVFFSVFQGGVICCIAHDLYCVASFWHVTKRCTAARVANTEIKYSNCLAITGCQR